MDKITLRRQIAIEEELQRIVGAWPEEVAAIAFLYLRALGWDTARAERVKRKSFGE